MKMILDVGCGLNPKGHVNVDLYFNESTPDLRHRNVVPAKHVSNPVKATAYMLPFKEATFSKVHSSQLIEHLYFPRMAIEEMLRVAKHEVEIVVPHRFVKMGLLRRPHYHVQLFGVSNFRKLIASFKLPFELNITWKYLPHNLVPLIRLPRDLRANIYLS